MGYVYILTNYKFGTLYIGVTNQLLRRIQEHKEKKVGGFTKKYNLTRLVYVESYERIGEAIFREKCMKKWLRKWKLEAITKENPEWRDLYQELLENWA